MVENNEEQKTFLVVRIKADKLEDWLNERDAEGYILERIYMERGRSDPPKFTVIMRLDGD